VATKLFLRSTQNNALGATYFDMVVAAGSVTATGVVNSAASGTEIQWTQTAGGAVLQFVSGRVPAGGFTLTSTDISIWAAESNALANAGGRYRVFKRSAAGVETELGGGPFNDGVEFGTSAAEMLWVGNVTDTAFAEDDRILLKLYITNIGTMGASRTCTLTYNGADAATGDSFFNIAETVSFKAEAVTGSAGTATESEAAQAPSGKAVAAVGLATSPATGLALSGKAIAALGVGTSSGAGLALAGVHVRAAGVSNVSDAAIALGSARPSGLAGAAESAIGLARALVGACAAAITVDAARQLGAATAAAAAIDPCQALALGRVIVQLAGNSGAIESSTALAPRALRGAAAAGEADTASALTGAVAAPAGIALGSGSAATLAPIGLKPVAAANDNGLALQLAPGGSAGPVELAAANDNALALGLATPLGTAVEAAGAQFMLKVSLRSVEFATASGTALALVAGQPAPPGPVPASRTTVIAASSRRAGVKASVRTGVVSRCSRGQAA
jgi:hypothetical protein